MEKENAVTDREPTRDEVDRMPGLVLLEFGARWCGYCRAAAPEIASALRLNTDVRHIKVEDGPGRPLGRSFRVKLWPTLIFLRDGAVVARVVRPDAREIREGFESLRTSAHSPGGQAESP
jgi:thioredoxin 1